MAAVAPCPLTSRIYGMWYEAVVQSSAADASEGDGSTDFSDWRFHEYGAPSYSYVPFVARTLSHL